jgi:hypothetical protein
MRIYDQTLIKIASRTMIVIVHIEWWPPEILQTLDVEKTDSVWASKLFCELKLCCDHGDNTILLKNIL